MYANNIQLVRKFASEHEALRVVAQKNSKELRLFDFNTAGGFLGLTLLSIISLIGTALGVAMLLKNTHATQVEDKRTTKLSAAADQLLGTIDLGLNKSAGTNVQDVKAKAEPQLSAAPKAGDDKKNLASAGNAEIKTVTNVITEISQGLRDKIMGIESQIKVLSQLGNKLRHSVSTLQDKSAQLRSGSSAQADGFYGVSASADRGGPLEQLQDAFFALKQQGVRLYLAILDNHSSKQLAVETEQLNLLVERVETTVSKIRSSLAQVLDQAADSQTAAPQVSPEVIELLNMDAKQVMRDLDLWQEEFDGLGRAFGELKREIKV
jgi:hypothetical protein